MTDNNKGPSLDALLRAAEKHARATLIGGKAGMMPICHLVRDDGQEAIIGAPWRDAREKDITLKMLAMMMREDHMIRYMVVCEAWMRNATPEEAANHKLGDPLPVISPIAEHPDRVEVVVACARERGEKRFRVWETKRDKHGQCVDLVEITEPNENWQGPWTELLPLDA